MTDPRQRLIDWLAAALLDYTPPLPGPCFPLIAGEADEVAEAALDAGEKADPDTLGLMLDGLEGEDSGHEKGCLQCSTKRGAEQERERLRAKSRDEGFAYVVNETGDWMAAIDSLLADPEATNGK